MEMRELTGDDIFPVMAILGKLELKDELVKVFDEGRTGSTTKMTKGDIESRGMKVMAALVQQVLRNSSVVREDINALLADLTGKTVGEIKALKLTEYTKLLVAFGKKPELKEVFTSAVSLMGVETASTSSKI